MLPRSREIELRPLRRDAPAPAKVSDDSSTSGDRADLGTAHDLTAAIRRRAWERHVERGGCNGYDLEDWLEAERELLESPRLAELAARVALR
jgi:hypothetical protein